MRAPRVRFAAPLVLTLATGCPSTVDHRPTTEETHTMPIANPPPPAATTDQPAGPGWKIVVDNDGTCVAAVNTSCTPGRPATCNPPRPIAYACPAGANNDRPYIIEQHADGCVLIAPPPECKPGTMCNPPPAQKVDCPTR